MVLVAFVFMCKDLADGFRSSQALHVRKIDLHDPSILDGARGD